MGLQDGADRPLLLAEEAGHDQRAARRQPRGKRGHHPRELRRQQIRHDEGTRAAAVLGADFSCLDLGDYPLLIDTAAIDRLTAVIVERAPDIIITHTDRDPFNPDHSVAYAAVERARQLASGAGVASAFTTIRPPELLLFEPHQPELCGFVPTTFLDITPVFAQKEQAMAAMAAISNSMPKPNPSGPCRDMAADSVLAGFAIGFLCVSCNTSAKAIRSSTDRPQVLACTNVARVLRRSARKIASGQRIQNCCKFGCAVSPWEV